MTDKKRISPVTAIGVASSGFAATSAALYSTGHYVLGTMCAITAVAEGALGVFVYRSRRSNNNGISSVIQNSNGLESRVE